MKPLEHFGITRTRSLHQAALEKWGSEEAVAHQIELLKRRLRYQPVVQRNFPTETDFVREQLPSGKWVVIPYAHWETRHYVQWFEAANSLKPITGETK